MHVELEDRVRALHPLHKIGRVLGEALASLDGDFKALSTDFGRPSFSPANLSLVQPSNCICQVVVADHF